MKNKIAAILLCLGVAISTLCACSNTGNGGDQPAEETTIKQTEAVTEAPTTEETTESETTEPSTPEGDVIIPLFPKYHTLDEIKQVSATDLFQMYNFSLYFDPLTTEKFTENGIPLYQFRNGTTFQMINPADTESSPFTVEIYLYFDSDLGNTFNLYYVIDETEKSLPFLPILYNQSKGCFVGYDSVGTLSELSYSPEFGGMGTLPVDDPSVYGF